MRKPKKLTKYQEAITHMPPLSNYPDRSLPFDLKDSPMMQWIMSQPELWAYLHEKVKDKELVVFNPDTQLWQGREYQP